MSVSDWNGEPSGGSVIAGCFLLAMGLCLLFLGGSCTLIVLGSAITARHISVAGFVSMLFAVLIPLAIAVAGAAMIRAGLRHIGG